MKTFKNILVSLTAVVFASGLILNFSACSEQTPMQSNNKTVSTKRAPGELNILQSKIVQLNKAFVAEKLITVENGGRVEVGDWLHGKSRLNFKPGDVSQDVLVRFDWESTGLLEGGAEFSPHGTTFNNPVEIRLSYKDADLNGINEADLHIWYFNETDGTWELIASEVHPDKKYIKGYINHFSRYAIAAE